jgi:hypothetical protein
VVPAGALPVPVSDSLNAYVGALIARFSPARAGCTAGQSSFTAVPGRQHNCSPSALLWEVWGHQSPAVAEAAEAEARATEAAAAAAALTPLP